MSDADDMANALPAPAVSVPSLARRGGVSFATTRVVPDEQAVAFTYNGSTHAVMMATPADLEDFAVGFALTEGLIESRSEIENLEIVTMPLGIEARVWLKGDRAEAYAKRRRSMAGPTGCGLCGIESLEAAMRPLSTVTADLKVSPQSIVAAMASLDPAQTLNDQTHAVHGAAFWTEREGLVAVREDVGRHNALDKLIGALVRAGRTAANGLVLMTSRVSIELIQKAARLNAPVLVAVSAPTAAAIRLADEAGITLVAVARRQDFEAFTHTERLSETSRHVA
ncbi:formate dehydrogenase accessory sulfurtransferase FdhD [uncultured Methylovirgula sp.]|uniref:formate dehydrogenase accessory sulfurtransferase FdhD n=1 Tax=uncultured Methylovirgula sp. TaxID=1285960 RepID=UPI002608DBFE|nr:formate dehydrogenase accessory sulfurtransferase FdhD [uncultured Methylovirgula sp.]